MADISSSAAKQHVLSGAGDEVSRMSGDAVQVARDLGHQFFQNLVEQQLKKHQKQNVKPSCQRIYITRQDHCVQMAVVHLKAILSVRAQQKVRTSN